MLKEMISARKWPPGKNALVPCPGILDAKPPALSSIQTP
jgi:hypothetical protein